VGGFCSGINPRPKSLFILVTVVTALIAVGGSYANDVLYCMPQGSVAYRAGDGTWGTSVQLVEGQPLSDPTYAGATPAEAITIVDQEIPTSHGGVVVAFHYSLSCDPPPPGFVFTGSYYSGVYPIFNGVSSIPPPGNPLPGGVTGSTTATAPKAPPKKPKLKKPTKLRH
jgi:hypothetical protein